MNRVDLEELGDRLSQALTKAHMEGWLSETEPTQVTVNIEDLKTLMRLVGFEEF